MRDSVKAIYESKSKQRSLVANIWAHDIAQRLRIRRKILANDSGLGELDVGTYPSHGSVNVVDGGGFWKGLLVAGLAAGGLGMASGLFQPGVVAPPVVATPAVSVPQEWELEIISVDGEPQVRGERVETTD